MELDEQERVGVDLEHLEHTYRHQKLYTIPQDQLRKVHKVFLNSSAGSTSRLGIALDQNTGPKKIPRESKRRGRKPAHQLIREAGNLMINSGQIHKLSERYRPTSPTS